MEFKILSAQFEYFTDSYHKIKSVLINELGNPILRSNLIPKINDELIRSELNSITETEWVLRLPEVGEQVIINNLYLYSTEIASYTLKCRQTHNRTIYDPIDIPALFSFYRENSDDLEWIPNEWVEIGWKRWYNEEQYEVIQAHQTQSDWTPNIAITLWKVYDDPLLTEVWAIGVAYKVDDVVTYNGSEYKCLQVHTSIASWTPLVASLWLKL